MHETHRRPGHLRRLLLVLTLLASLLELARVTPAYAAACSPTTPAELVTAINDANAGTCPGNTITLAAGATYTFTAPSYTNDFYYGDAALPLIDAPMIIEGNGAIIERSAGAETPRFRLFLVDDGNLTIRNLTLRNGAANTGRYYTPHGGCILADHPLTVQSSTLTNCSPGTNGNGAAIAGLSTFLVDSSAIYNNQGGGDSGTLYAAVYVEGNATIRNSTLSGNHDMGVFVGGGYSRKTVALVNSTVTGSTYGVVALNHSYANGIANLKNSIIAGNTFNTIKYNGDSGTGGEINDQGNNVLAGDPGLAPLAANGGPTLTHALRPGSPAVNAGDAATCADASGINNLDQRGVSRSVDRCDSGAYELEPVLTTLSAASARAVYGGQVNLSATLTLNGVPFPSQQVSFALNGTNLGSAITNLDGVARLIVSSLSGLNAGSYPHAVEVTFDGNSPYRASSDTADLTVTPADQTITISGVPASAVYSTTFTPAASSNTGLPVTIAVSGVCALSGTTVTMNAGVGSCVVTAKQAGSNNYSAATASQPVTAQPAIPAVSVTGGTYTYDGQPHAATASVRGVGGATVPGSFSYMYTPGGSSPPINAATYAVTATFASSDPNYGTGSGTGSLIIDPTTPTMSVTGGPFTYDGQPHPATATATGIGGVQVSGSFSDTYTPGGSSAPVNAGTYAVSAGFTSSDPNYTGGTGAGSITIDKAPQAISVGPTPDRIIGADSFALSATAASGLPVSLSSTTPAVCTVSGTTVTLVGVGTCAISAAQAGNANYLPVSATRSFAVRYDVCLLYDPAKSATKAGSTLAVKLYVCDAAGMNVSSPRLSLQAVTVDGSAVPVKNSRSANPNDLFRFNTTLTGGGGYIYNLNTTGLSKGAHTLSFSISSATSTSYSAPFMIK